MGPWLRGLDHFDGGRTCADFCWSLFCFWADATSTFPWKSRLTLFNGVTKLRAYFIEDQSVDLHDVTAHNITAMDVEFVRQEDGELVLSAFYLDSSARDAGLPWERLDGQSSGGEFIPHRGQEVRLLADHGYRRAGGGRFVLRMGCHCRAMRMEKASRTVRTIRSEYSGGHSVNSHRASRRMVVRGPRRRATPPRNQPKTEWRPPMANAIPVLLALLFSPPQGNIQGTVVLLGILSAHLFRHRGTRRAGANL